MLTGHGSMSDNCAGHVVLTLILRSEAVTTDNQHGDHHENERERENEEPMHRLL